MSLANSGGVLHGTWVSDVTISTSDRRLKKNIKSIDQTLAQNYAEKEGASNKPEAGGADAGGRSSAATWVLRQLRPVSYNFRKGPEAKHMRFGFIADEIEQVLPQVVRELPGAQNSSDESDADEKPENKKGIMYTDLIAVLTTVVKDFNHQLKTLKDRMQTAEAELEHLDKDDPMTL